EICALIKPDPPAGDTCGAVTGRRGSFGTEQWSPSDTSFRQKCPMATTVLRQERPALSDHRVVRQRLGGDEGGGHGLVPLVLLGAVEAGPVESLLFGVAGEHAEAHGLARVDGDPVEPVGGGLADIVEVRGAAADDDAEGHDRVEVR